VTLDARKGRKASVTLDPANPTHVVDEVNTLYTVKDPDITGGAFHSIASISGGAGNDLYAVPVKGDPKTFAFAYDTVRTTPTRTYRVAIPVNGQIPSDLQYRVHDKDLQSTDTRYHAQGVAAAVADRVDFLKYFPDQLLSVAPIVPVPLPSQRLELHSPGGSWQASILQQYLPRAPKKLFDGELDESRATFKAGRTDRQDWNLAALGPDLASPDIVGNGYSAGLIIRDGSQIAVQFSPFSPGEPGHTESVFNAFYSSGSTILTAGDAQIGRSPYPGLGSFASVPPGNARYTLTVMASRSPAWSTLGTKATVVWNFASAPTTAVTPLSLPTVKVSGAFDDRDRAPGGKPFTLLINAGTPLGATPSKVTAVTVEVSDDDGTTWSPVRANDDEGDLWRANLINPGAAHGTGFVSLHIKAVNAAGNTLEQTIIRAYALA
jgi:hypothetical protein